MKKERKRILRLLLLVGAIVCLIVIGVRLLADRRYTLISMTIAFLSCFSFYHAYEKKEGGIRRMVMIAVMTTIAVLGRLIFGPIPGFKPVSAIVILTGMYMGAESGFLVGSLTAVISNIFFGQGPWTPFQMLTLGTIGMLSGLPGLRDLLKKRGPLVVWGILMGFLYSGIMDIWSVLDLQEPGRWKNISWH